MIDRRWPQTLLITLMLLLCGASTRSASLVQAEGPTANASTDANRLAYLDEFCDPYYPSLDMPKLITPQWIGEPGVEAVITLLSLIHI